MRISHIIYNLFQSIIQFQRKLNYIVYPVIIAILYNVMYFKGKITIDKDLISNIINISGVLIGFLFASHSILLALPSDKKFITLAKEYGYFKRMFICIFGGESFLMLALITGLFKFSNYICLMLFLVGLTYTTILSVNLFLVSFYIFK